MADSRKRYTLTLAGIEHTVLLSERGAARYGDLAKPVEQKKSEDKQPASKKKSE